MAMILGLVVFPARFNRFRPLSVNFNLSAVICPMGFPQHFIFLARSIQNFFILFLLFDYEFRQFLSLSVGVRSVVCVSFCIAVECSTTKQKFNMLRKKRKNQQQQQFWQTKHRVWIKARTIVSTNNISGTNARIQRTERKKMDGYDEKKELNNGRASERTNECYMQFNVNHILKSQLPWYQNFVTFFLFLWQCTHSNNRLSLLSVSAHFTLAL